MDNFVNSLCIVIASHLSNTKRICYLIECLESLIQQTVPISVYLSISFQTQEIKEEFFNNQQLSELCSKIILRIQERKTPQMRHIYLLYPELQKKHKWIMFCDDDDTYEPSRVERIAQNIYAGDNQCKQLNKTLSGLYESTFGKDHREHRHEYWCYCINIEMLGKFYEKLLDYPDIIDNKCCDVLFAEYLRRASPEHLYCQLTEKLYNYRIEDNTDSITGYIKGNQQKYTRFNQQPAITDINFADYVVDWNECLYENMDVYLHDIFLRTIVGCNLDYILKAEFRSDSELFGFVDSCHLEKIQKNHKYWRGACDELFDIPFS
jgi:glycosyltransferase involved in cell wall biosynthesis